MDDYVYSGRNGTQPLPLAMAATVIITMSDQAAFCTKTMSAEDAILIKNFHERLHNLYRFARAAFTRLIDNKQISSIPYDF